MHEKCIFPTDKFEFVGILFRAQYIKLKTKVVVQNFESDWILDRWRNNPLVTNLMAVESINP